MSTINKAQFWQDHITAWQGSGLSQAAYCKQHEIKFHNFAYWRNRLSSRKTCIKIDETQRDGCVTPCDDEFTAGRPIGIVRQ
jgi:hypothetical protein